MSSSRAIVPYTGRGGAVKIDLGDQAYGVSNADALYDYYADNEAIVHTDAVMRTLIGYISNKLFGAGIQFIRGTAMLRPPPDFDPDAWVPFLIDTLPFIVAHGALVFYIHQDPQTRVSTPHVPEWPLIVLRDAYDETTKQPIVTVEWRDAERADRLYVFNTGNPFGRKPTRTGAPVDAVKDLLRQYYYNLEMHTVAKDHNSRPPIVLQSKAQQRDPAVLANELGVFDSELERRMLQNMHTVGLDELFIQRIKMASDPERRTYSAGGGGGGSGGPMPWWARARARIAAPPEQRFMYIPHGLEAQTSQQSFVDAGFSKEQGEIIQAIYSAFGIPYTALLSAASQQSSTGIELHKTMLVDTLRVWQRIYSTILTDVYRIIFDVQGVPLAMETADGEPAGDAVKDGRFKKAYTTVHLRSAFITTPEHVTALYHDGVISWQTFQDMRLEALNLPTALADRSVPPAARLNAQTQAQMLAANAKPKPGASSSSS